MSHQAVQTVLERTLSDEAFRARFFANPQEVLSEFELTAGESAALLELSVDSGEAESTPLDQRASKRPLWTAGL